MGNNGVDPGLVLNTSNLYMHVWAAIQTQFCTLGVYLRPKRKLISSDVTCQTSIGHLMSAELGIA
jgi:hypothetical protein